MLLVHGKMTRCSFHIPKCPEQVVSNGNLLDVGSCESHGLLVRFACVQLLSFGLRGPYANVKKNNYFIF